MSKEIRLGIIGVGNMGSAHARMVQEGKVPGMKLEAVADRRKEQAAAFSEAKFFDEGSKLIEWGGVDAVIIATPHYDHTTLGIQALEAGLHTLVEKPISVHKADCERLIAAHKDKNVIFAAMFNQRTVPMYRKLKQLIDAGEIGRINRIQWTITDWYRTDFYYASGGWRATWAGEGGGVLLNQCPHQLDLWQWLFGMPDRVWAQCEFGRFHDIEVEDRVTAVMNYKDGKSGVFITTTGEAPGTNRLEVAAERGRLILENGKMDWIRNEIESSEYLRIATKSFSRPEKWMVEVPISGKAEQHLGIMTNFARAITDGEPLIAPASEGIHSVELANSMLLSSFEGKEVSVPIDGALYEKHLKERIASSKPKKKVVEPQQGGSDDFAKSF